MNKKREISVSFRVSVPAEIQPAELLEWLAFELGSRGEIRIDNPLADHDLEAVPFSVSYR